MDKLLNTLYKFAPTEIFTIKEKFDLTIKKTYFINLSFIISIILLCFLKKDYVLCNMHMALFIISFYFILQLTKTKEIKNIFLVSNKNIKFLSFFLSCLGIIMLNILEWKKSNLFNFSNGIGILRIIYIIGFILFVIPTLFISVFSLILYFINTVINQNKANQLVNKKEFYLSFGIISIFTILILLSAFPGIFHGDGTNVLRYVMANRWSDWHPITYYLFVNLCMLIIKHPFMVIIIQTILFLITQYLALNFIKNYCKKNSCYLYSITILTAGIPCFSYLDVFYKDTPHFIGFLGFTIMLLSYIKGQQKKKDLCILFAYGLFTASMRHISILIITISLLLCCFTLYLIKEKRAALKLLTCSFLILISFIALKSSLLTLTNTEKNPKYVSYTMPLHMLGSYASSGYKMDLETQNLLNKIMPIDKWIDAYNSNPYLADTLSRKWSYIGDGVDIIEQQNLYPEIIKGNWNYLIHYPTQYLNDFFNMNTLVWEMGTPADGYEWLPTTFINSDDTLVKKFPEYEVHHTLTTEILEPIINTSKSLPLWKMISYRGGFFNFIIICAFFSLLIVPKNRKECLVCIPTLFSSALLLLSIPAQDPRFILPTIASGCFILIYCLNRNNISLNP